MKEKKKKELNKEELNDVISLSKKILKVLYIVLIVGIVCAGVFLAMYLGLPDFLISILKVISPLFIGFIIAWLFNPLVKNLTSKGLSRILSALMVYLVFLVFIMVFIRVFIPVLYSQINDLVAIIPTALQKGNDILNEFIMSFNTETIDLTTVKDNIIINLESAVIGYTTQLPNLLLNIIVNLFSGIGTIVIGLVVGLYMLFDFDKVANFFVNIIPKKNRYEIETLLNTIGAEVRKSVNGTLLVALMVFVTDTVGFTIVGLEAPLLFGLLCGLTDLIPYIGPYIGGAAATLMGFSQGPVIGFSVLIICIIVQLVESYVLQPVVMSKAVQLHPVTIIIGLLIFGHFFGIIGMVFATPCLAILKVMLNFVKNKYAKI
ncbi:MAG: AI-2E family transporter [Bacilli bacterium]|nr:AI-2E family transporter [Bacilli bacterium]